ATDGEMVFPRTYVPRAFSRPVNVLSTVTVGILASLFNSYTFLRSVQFIFKMPPKPKLNVHNFPRPPLLERTPRHLQIKWHGQLIADTKDAYWVLETTH